MRISASFSCALITAILVSGCASTSAPPKVKVIKRYEANVTATGIQIEPRTVRAWMEDIERDAAAATLLKKLEDYQYIGGLAINPKGEVLTFSLLETVQTMTAEERKAAAEKKAEAGATQAGGLSTDGLRTIGNLRSMRAIEGGGITQITTGNWYDIQPATSPGGQLTFAANRLRPRGIDLFRISTERTGGVSVLRQGGDGFSYAPSVARDGTVAFEFLPVYPGELNSQVTPQIWVQGGTVPFPTQLREGTEPSISPDGSEIAFIGQDGQLWVMPVTGQTPVQLTTSPVPKDPLSSRLMTKRSPTWTPDGTRLVYSAADGKDGQEKPNYDIWIVSKLGGNPLQLTTNGSEDRTPVVDPEQKYIYFVSNRGFKEGLWRIPFPL